METRTVRNTTYTVTAQRILSAGQRMFDLVGPKGGLYVYIELPKGTRYIANLNTSKNCTWHEAPDAS